MGVSAMPSTRIIFFQYMANTDKPLGCMADFSQGPADGTHSPRPARHAILGQHPRVGRFATWRETELEKRNSSSQNGQQKPIIKGMYMMGL